MNDGLRERLRSSGYTPAARDVARLFELFGSDDERVSKDVERALSRAGLGAAHRAVELFESSEPPLRSRLVALVGKIAASTDDPALIDWLVRCLEDRDLRARRRAARALGKLRDRRLEAPLVRAWDLAERPEERRALAAALGNVGGELTLGRLERERGGDPELDRLIREARLKIERASLRGGQAHIDPVSVPARPLAVLLHVRAGLEELAQDELGPAARSTVAGRGRIETMLEGSLGDLFRIRTLLHFGFPLPAEEAPDPVEGVVRALTSEAAREIFSTFTRGTVRYRIEWASAGRRRSATFRVAERVARACPNLVNDGTGALWEAVVVERSHGSSCRVLVELWPRALSDPRFGYRKRTVPAASHPTVAAALARYAGALPDDVVWDPFVGSGMELAERALLGPYGALFGFDTSGHALDAARENLAAVGAKNAHLALGDARTARPSEPATLVITNPPFGQRVLGPHEIRSLLDETLANVARGLRPGGRVVWVSPIPDTTAALAGNHGFAVRLRRPLDLGGKPAEIQALSFGGSRERSRRLRGPP